MKRDVAEKLMDTLLQCHRLLDSAEGIVRIEIEDADEQRRILEGIGSCVGEIYTEVMMPIIKAFPDLDPDPR